MAYILFSKLKQTIIRLMAKTLSDVFRGMARALKS